MKKYRNLLIVLLSLSLLLAACDYDGDGIDDGLLPDFETSVNVEATEAPVVADESETLPNCEGAKTTHSETFRYNVRRGDIQPYVGEKGTLFVTCDVNGKPGFTFVEGPALETPVVVTPDNSSDGNAPAACTFAKPASDLDTMPKTVIELAAQNTWFHRVFNERLFHAPDWGGADSWFVTLALGANSGGSWTDHGNPGQIVYRGTSTELDWCLGVLTTEKWMDQFMAGDPSEFAAINVRIAPNSMVTVVTASGKTVTQATSDAGDITIILPKSGVITISVDYTTAAPTHESLVWWGPYDRSENINTIDASK